MASKSSSELESSTATVIVEVIVPSIMLSSTPETVMVCGVSQLAVVNVSEEGMDISLPSFEESDITTFDVGWASKTTVNVSVVPDSSTSVAPSSSTMVNPATSSSVVVAETV